MWRFHSRHFFIIFSVCRMWTCMLLLCGYGALSLCHPFSARYEVFLPVVEAVVNVNAIVSIAFSLGKTNILRRIHIFYLFTRFCFWPTIPLPISFVSLYSAGPRFWMPTAVGSQISVLHLNLVGKFTESVSKCEYTIDTNVCARTHTHARTQWVRERGS